MELYIGNIPDDIDDYDLRKFFQVAGEQASFRVVTQDGGHNKPHRYGLASFASNKLALQVAKRFNSMLFKDKHIVIKVYTHRNCSNDRRALNWREVEWNKTERRIGDRRGVMVQGRTSVNEGVAVFNLG